MCDKFKIYHQNLLMMAISEKDHQGMHITCSRIKERALNSMWACWLMNISQPMGGDLKLDCKKPRWVDKVYALFFNGFMFSKSQFGSLVIFGLNKVGPNVNKVGKRWINLYLRTPYVSQSYRQNQIDFVQTSRWKIHVVSSKLTRVYVARCLNMGYCLSALSQIGTTPRNQRHLLHIGWSGEFSFIPILLCFQKFSKVLCCIINSYQLSSEYKTGHCVS